MNDLTIWVLTFEIATIISISLYCGIYDTRLGMWLSK